MKKLLFLLFLPGRLLAQSVTDSLQEVEVKGNRTISAQEQLLKQNTGRVQTFDTTQLALYQTRTVADLVSEQSPVFIKSYGYNSLSTLSFRGASAAQSLVLWNGVPVNNPALGVADLSLLPVFFADEISIAYGGSSALLGNGNVGGALILDNSPPGYSRGREAGAYAGLGSFGQWTLGLNYATSLKQKEQWRFSVKALAQQAENDFSYQDEAGNRQELDHARQRSGQAFVALAHKLAVGSLSLKAWGQYGTREIPPALFEKSSLQQQTDQAFRLVADWQHQSNTLKMAYLLEGMDYKNPSSRQESQTRTHRLFLSDSWTKNWKAQQLTLMLPLQVDWLQGRKEYQSQIALAALYQYQLKSWQLQLQARAGWYDDRFAATPGLGLSWQAKPWLSAYLSAQRSFRQPTLNELYYQPGGNPLLKPEVGWSGEGGYKIDFKKKDFRLQQEGALFARSMENWIIWYGSAIWTPHNIAAVYSRGAETQTTLHWQKRQLNISLSLQTAYVLSTTEKSDNPMDGSIGKQLPYVPRYNYRLGGRMGWKGWLLSFSYGYTGYRFVTSDESQFLLPYELSGVQLSYSFLWGRQEMKLQGACQNIFGESYQVVASRPMPGRVWQLNVQLRF